MSESALFTFEPRVRHRGTPKITRGSRSIEQMQSIDEGEQVIALFPVCPADPVTNSGQREIAGRPPFPLLLSPLTVSDTPNAF